MKDIYVKLLIGGAVCVVAGTTIFVLSKVMDYGTLATGFSLGVVYSMFVKALVEELRERKIIK